MLADPQHALDLHTTADAARRRGAGGRGAAAREAPDRGAPSRARRSTSTCTPTPSAALGRRRPATGPGTWSGSTGYGPRSLETIQQWLADLPPAPIKLTPVVDLTEHISVDAYELPDRLRTQIEHRDHGCRFPWCGRRGRYDLDHIDPYLPLDDGGPPGQTNTHNTREVVPVPPPREDPRRLGLPTRRPTTLTWTSPLGHATPSTSTAPAPARRTSAVNVGGNQSRLPCVPPA